MFIEALQRELEILHAVHCCCFLDSHVFPVIHNGLNNVNDADLRVRVVLDIKTQIVSEEACALTDISTTLIELSMAPCSKLAILLTGSLLSKIAHYIKEIAVSCGGNQWIGGFRGGVDRMNLVPPKLPFQSIRRRTRQLLLTERLWCEELEHVFAESQSYPKPRLMQEKV